MADTTYRLMQNLASARILVYGDFALDEFLHGSIDRISREAPVFIVSHENSEFRPGCAANAAANAAALGAQVSVYGLTGTDEYGRILRRELEAFGIKTAGLHALEEFCTPLKTRVIAGGKHSVRQQIVRIDRLHNSIDHSQLNTDMRSALEKGLENCDAVLISDYGIGCIDQEIALWLLKKAKAENIPVLVDSRYQLETYAGATAMTPNQPEAEALAGTQIQNEEQLHAIGTDLIRRLNVDALVITRGGEGMSLFTRDAPVLDIPAYGDDEVVDVTGAGDTVIATVTLALAAGNDFATSARLANVTGGLSVLKKGTSTITPEEIIEALSRNPMP